MENPKTQIPNYKQIQNKENQNSKPFRSLKNLNLDIVWSLVLGIWKLRGFTIIELLISISIIAILLSISFAGYARLNQRQTLIASGQNLKNIIRDAQNRSLNTELDCTKCDCTAGGNTQFSGWYVDFSSQKIYGKCAVSTFGDKPFGLSSDIVITPYVTPANELNFKNNPPSASGKGTICVVYNNLASNYYVIRVAETGAISDDGGLVSSCTP